jgi:hypothetical protein
VATMVVTGTAAGAATAARSKPKRALKGRRRAAVRKLLHYASIVLSQDQNEAARAETNNYVPYLFGVRQSAPENKALLSVISRCMATLNAVLQ